jgi:endonuclease/exonuclease/phosphatase family metal-dependent hydrolase
MKDGNLKFVFVSIMLLTFVLFGFTDIPEKAGNLIKIPISTTLPYVDPCTDGCIRIASWNIQNFGAKKASDNETMRAITDMVSQYDIIAVQEISNVYEQADPGCFRNEGKCPGHENCGLLMESLEENLNNRLGLDYGFAFSPQVKDERYLYIYDRNKVSLEESKLTDDPDETPPACDLNQEDTGLMIRQPFYGKFNASDFVFTLLTAHTSPEANFRELEGLRVIYDNVREGDDNVMVLGDLNADCSYLKYSDSISFRSGDYVWVVDDYSDTTVAKSDCAYDRFIFDEDMESHFTGRWGIDRDVTKDVSDHYLVWAEFSLKEK